MNKDKLRSLCQKLSKETGISFNSIQTHYFLESILEKISISDESNNFIFKGGFLLANVIGSIIDLISKLKSEKDIRIRWKNYQMRFRYAEEISFDEVIDTVIEIVEKIK